MSLLLESFYSQNMSRFNQVWDGVIMASTTAGLGIGMHKGLKYDRCHSRPVERGVDIVVKGVLGGAMGCFIGMTAPVSIPLLTYHRWKSGRNFWD